VLRPFNTDMTAFRPDAAVVDRLALTKEPLWSEQSVLTLGQSIKFVAAVVSSNWQKTMRERLKTMQLLVSLNTEL